MKLGVILVEQKRRASMRSQLLLLLLLYTKEPRDPATERGSTSFSPPLFLPLHMENENCGKVVERSAGVNQRVKAARVKVPGNASVSSTVLKFNSPTWETSWRHGERVQGQKTHTFTCLKQQQR